MVVYVLEGWINWEGSEVLRIFSSREKADAYVDTIKKDGCYDSYSVTEWEIV